MSKDVVKMKKGSSIRKTKGEHIFEAIVIVVLVLLSMCMLFPFINLLAKSFSAEAYVITGNVYLWPRGFQLGTYQFVLKQAQFFKSFRNTVIITLAGTFGAMIVNCMTAYPLSRTRLVGRKAFILYFVFTMLFSGGMVPSYLLRNALGLLNTLWVLFVPGLLSVYNMILLKNFFEEIPEEIEESAQLDGAGSMTVLFKIILPMSLPAIATIGLFYAVGFWNNYMDGVLYITRAQYKPLQQYLYEVVTEMERFDKATAMGQMDADTALRASLTTESIRAATIMIASVPIMLVYPFLQKYFVAGLRVGSVKG